MFSVLFHFASLLQPSTVLDRKLRHCLARLHALGAFTGLQIAVVARDRRASNQAVFPLATIAAGTIGPLDQRPVRPDTRFPVLGLSRVAAIAAVRLALRQRSLSLACKVSSAWPAFGAEGKSNCTVSELLRCRSGIEGKHSSFLKEFSFLQSTPSFSTKTDGRLRTTRPMIN